MKVTETSSNSNINGIGGVAKGKVVEIELESRNKEKSIVINATVVDEIMHLQREDVERFNKLTKSSAEALRKREGFAKSQKVISNKSQEVEYRCSFGKM